MGFSENLYHLRSSHNMTQEQLAMLMGVSRQAISKWESGRAYPEMTKLVRLCGIFECDLNGLVRGDMTEIEARPALVIPGGALPMDVCGYDRHMRSHALLVACAIGVPLLSIAVFFGTSPTSLVVFDAGEPVPSFLSRCTYGLPVLVVGLLTGLLLATVAVYRHLGFRGRYPYVEDFYTDEQRKATSALVHRARVVAGVSGAIALVACGIKAGPLFHVGGGLCSLFAWGAVAAWSSVWAALMQARLNVARYNERNAASLDEREAVEAYAALPDTHELVAANPELPRLAQAWVKRRTAAVCIAILVAFGLLGAVLFALDLGIFFIPLMVGTVLAMLAGLFLPYMNS